MCVIIFKNIYYLGPRLRSELDISFICAQAIMGLKYSFLGGLGAQAIGLLSIPCLNLHNKKVERINFIYNVFTSFAAVTFFLSLHVQ